MNCWFKQLFRKRCTAKKKRTDDFNQIDMKTCFEVYPNVNEPSFYAVSTWCTHTRADTTTTPLIRRVAVSLCVFVRVLGFSLTFFYRILYIVRLCLCDCHITQWERERKRERHNGRSDKTLYVLNVYMNAAAAVSSVCSSSIHTLHFAYVTLILISFILFVAFISIRVSKL